MFPQDKEDRVSKLPHSVPCGSRIIAQIGSTLRRTVIRSDAIKPAEIDSIRLIQNRIPNIDVNVSRGDDVIFKWQWLGIWKQSEPIPIIFNMVNLHSYKFFLHDLLSPFIWIVTRFWRSGW